MTSRQRVLAALQHRQPDRTPIFEYVLHSPVAEAFLGRPYAGDKAVFPHLAAEMGYEAACRRRAIDELDLAERFGFDMLCLRALPMTAAPAPPPEPAGDDPVGNLRRRLEALAGTEKHLSDAQRLQFVAVSEEMARRGLDLPALASACAHGVWTDADLMQTMLLAPEVAEAWFAAQTEIALARVADYLDLGIRQISVGGDFAGNRPIISPQAYRRFIVPEVRKVARCIRAAGARAVNASDGDLRYVIDDFLFGCEADGYIEIDGQAGMDLRELKLRYGDRITFYGNFDCMRVLCFGSPEAVRAHAVETIEAGLAGAPGGHVLCCNNAVTAAVPVRNYRALQQAYREYFELPPLGP